MKTFKNLGAILFIFFLSFPAWSEGQDVGNGGFVVTCKPSEQNQLVGNYSLDYLLMQKPDSYFTPAESLASSLDNIGKLIKEKLPTLEASFDDYRKNLFNETEGKSRVWKQANSGIQMLSPSQLPSIGNLPENCISESGDVPVQQGAVRLYSSYTGSINSIYYIYDVNLLAQLQAVSPLQTSILIVHEWLWDHTQVPNLNLRVNSYLHSKQFAQAPASEALQTLLAMGFKVPTPEETTLSSGWCQPSPTPLTAEEISQALTNLNSFQSLHRIRACEESSCQDWSGAKPLKENGFFNLSNDNFLQLYALKHNEVNLLSNCHIGKYGRLNCDKYKFNYIAEAPIANAPPGTFENLEGVINKSCFSIKVSWQWKIFENSNPYVQEEFVLFSKID